ncbi:hypothetical protein MMC19_001087 [Ptychographa xylographoides]|nr:hypothetical protein [Ptychographa xylographoides]
MVVRATCTDQSWDSPACSQYCTSESLNASKILVPCGASTWACDYNCTVATFTIPNEAFELTPSQKSSLSLAEATATVTVTAAPLAYSNYNATTAAVGAGVGLPLGLAFIIALSLFIWERKKWSHFRQLSRRVPIVPAREAKQAPMVVKPVGSESWPQDKKYESPTRPVQSARGDRGQTLATVHELRSVTPQYELDARPSSRIRNLP